MSTLWTPSGEHPVPRGPVEDIGQGKRAAKGGQPPPQGGRAFTGSQAGVAGPNTRTKTDHGRTGDHEPSPEEVERAQEELKAVQEQLLRTPAELVIANHAMGLWDLAALHLSSQPPQLPQAQLAIDALASLLEGLRGRLGEAETTLMEGLSQIRLAFVQIANDQRQGARGQAGS